MAVCKSPLTGGWGDANSGGYFGAELKAAGWDAVFVSGIAASPKYLMITDDKIELKDAAQLWGQDTVETENAIQSGAGDKKIRIACIGPASEKLSLISGIINDRGRAAARSGVGAVMGSKKLKAIALKGDMKIPVADEKAANEMRKRHIAEMGPRAPFIRKYGSSFLYNHSREEDDARAVIHVGLEHELGPVAVGRAELHVALIGGDAVRGRRGR